MEEVFREICRFVLISGAGRNARIQVVDRYQNRIIGNHPLIMVNGIPIEDQEKVLSLKPMNVKSISTVAGKYFYGSQSFDGIIDIELKKNDLAYLQDMVAFTAQEFIGWPLESEKYYRRHPRQLLKPQPSMLIPYYCGNLS